MEVVLYLRASTIKQSEEGYSLEYQRDKLIDYAKLKEWNVVEEYRDAGESGTARGEVRSLSQRGTLTSLNPFCQGVVQTSLGK